MTAVNSNWSAYLHTVERRNARPAGRLVARCELTCRWPIYCWTTPSAAADPAGAARMSAAPARRGHWGTMPAGRFYFLYDSH